ncbi:helix-turn-helix domain-containing protein [Agriterribacter sp.]|uniref:AraC family transcriptional regulator n=1 Tax=Agriterribacter sp. TaxID=2821509 RepID=UPI002B564D13|nr:helix-turn-helix domain-containing protein [Agriterribacter sp.]HRP57131.1 helix-turn-helix domain-containing protein [Agriterribacter sp.]
MQYSPDSDPSYDLKIHAGFKVVRDYSFSFDKVEISFKDMVRFIFPSTGYLIFNLFFGDDFTLRFLNYDLSEDLPHHLYITGLLSRGMLITGQQGTGGGYAMKIHPVIGYHFLRIPMYQLTDRQVRLSHIFDREGRPLRQLEANASARTLNDPGVKGFFSKYLPDKSVYLRDPVYHAVNKIISKKGIIQVKKLATECCMSERTLHRQFLLKVGLSPQSYAKIWQLHFTMELLKNNPGAKLQGIAFKAGYYDVAHLARDFREKLFVPPSQFYRDVNPMMQSYLDFPDSLQ